MSQSQQTARTEYPQSECDSVGSYLQKSVYTTEGDYVGKVTEVMLSFERGQGSISGLGLINTNQKLFKNSHKLGKIEFPFRWVRSVSDVVIVRPIDKETLAVE